MTTFLLYTALTALGAFVLTWALTWAVTAILRRRAILDLPNDRSSHTVPTPRGGGWAVMLALLPIWIWATAKIQALGDIQEILVIVGALVLIAVSWIDDRRGLGAGPRFAIQAVLIAAVMVMLPRDLSLTRGLLPMPLDRLAAGLIWLWFVNLFNFMDGIDGITGGSAAAMALGVAIIALFLNSNELDAFRGIMIVAVSCGFLVWNWHPARVFLGDVGSIPLGFLLGYLLIHLAMDGAPIAALIIALYYLTDATITLLRRAMRGEKVWQAHREHFYQRAVQRGRSHARVARMAVLVQLVLGLLAMLSTGSHKVALFLAVILVLWLLFWMLRRVPEAGDNVSA